MEHALYKLVLSFLKKKKKKLKQKKMFVFPGLDTPLIWLSRQAEPDCLMNVVFPGNFQKSFSIKIFYFILFFPYVSLGQEFNLFNTAISPRFVLMCGGGFNEPEKTP